MPDVSATCHAAVFFIVVGNLNTIQDALGCRDLVRAHNHKHIF